MFERISRNKFVGNEPLPVHGIISRRETDSVVIAQSNHAGQVSIKKFSRKAALEKLRLRGALATIASHFNSRSIKYPQIVVGETDDLLVVKANFLRQIKSTATDVKEKRLAFSVSHDNSVTGTSTLKTDVKESNVLIEGFRQSSDERCPILIETRARAALRAFLANRQPPENHNRRRDDEPGETPVASEPQTYGVVVVENDGFGLIIWNEEKGVCYEIEQQFSNKTAEEQVVELGDTVERIHTPSSLAAIGLGAVTHLIVVGLADFKDFAHKDFAERPNVPALLDFQLADFIVSDNSLPVAAADPDAIVAYGLLLSDARVPTINLNLDLEEEIRLKEKQRVELVEKQTETAARNLALVFCAPIGLAFVCAIIWYASLCMQNNYITERLTAATAEEATLSVVSKELELIKNSSVQAEKVGTQIGALRARQPANYLLLINLDKKWPRQGAWQIEDITSKPDGIVTVKGRTLSEAAITEFTQALDFSGEFDSIKINKGMGLAAGSSFGSPQSNTTSPGITKFTVEARYKPLAQPAAAGGAAAPAATTTTPNVPANAPPTAK